MHALPSRSRTAAAHPAGRHPPTRPVAPSTQPRAVRPSPRHLLAMASPQPRSRPSSRTTTAIAGVSTAVCAPGHHSWLGTSALTDLARPPRRLGTTALPRPAMRSHRGGWGQPPSHARRRAGLEIKAKRWSLHTSNHAQDTEAPIRSCGNPRFATVPL